MDGQIGTAVAQRSLRGVLRFCNASTDEGARADVYLWPEVYAESG
jgi:chromate reductase